MYFASTGCAVAEQVQDERQFRRRASRCRNRGQRVFKLLQGQRCGWSLRASKQILRRCAQVSVAAIGGVHGGAIGLADFGQRAAQQGAACVQGAPVSLGKRRAGKVERGAGGIFKAQAAQVVGDQSSLFELFGSRGEPVAHFSELEKGAVSR